MSNNQELNFTVNETLKKYKHYFAGVKGWKPINVRGVVHKVKSDKSAFPIFFRIRDEEGGEKPKTILVRYLGLERPGSREFRVMTSSLEKGATVEVKGIYSVTKKGKPMITCDNILLWNSPIWFATSGKNHLLDIEVTEDEETEDEDYVPETEDEETEDEDYVPETEDEETEDESSGFRVNDDIVLERDVIVFHGDRLRIQGLNSVPGGIVLKTKEADFYFNDMRKGYIAVEVTKNRYEPQFQNGYTILEKVRFHDLIKVLF